LSVITSAFIHLDEAYTKRLTNDKYYKQFVTPY